MQNENPSVAIVATLVIVLVLLGVIALLYWAARRLSLQVFRQAPRRKSGLRTSGRRPGSGCSSSPGSP